MKSEKYINTINNLYDEKAKIEKQIKIEVNQLSSELAIEMAIFEEWYSSMWVASFDKTKLCHYKSAKVQMAWLSWQASVNRKGHKLVPVELIERCISHIVIASCHPRTTDDDEMKMSDDIDALEKAMIEVVK